MEPFCLEPDIHFPDPLMALPDGILCAGGSLTVGNLLAAYGKGIFPWPQEGAPLLWFFPWERGVLHFDRFHLSASLKKFMRKTHFEVTYNAAFADVIGECSKVPRPGQDGTWIDSDMIKAYIDFHAAGFAHSVEVWEKGHLVGGVYGVLVKGVFSGESMFYHRDNASKVALVHLVDRLQLLGLEWMDIQMVTPLLEHMGGEYIPRKDFIRLLAQSQKDEVIFDTQRSPLT